MGNLVKRGSKIHYECGTVGVIVKDIPSWLLIDTDTGDILEHEDTKEQLLLELPNTISVEG